MRTRSALVELAVLTVVAACGSVETGQPGSMPSSTSASPFITAAGPSAASIVPTQSEAARETPAAIAVAPPPTSDRRLSQLMTHAGAARRDLTYCTMDGVDLKLDLFLPKKTGITPTLTVYVHGGAWTHGDKSGLWEVPEAPALLDAGFAVASLDYRLAPGYKFPGMLEDVKCGIRSLRAHAADYGIDSTQIGVWGTSSGGHLVSLVGTTDASAGFDAGQYLDESSRVQAVVDMFGPADLTRFFGAGDRPFVEALFGGFDQARASPATYISADDPPFLLLHGDADLTVPLAQSQALYDSLSAGGVSAQLVIVKDGPHNLDSPAEIPPRAELTEMVVDFFKEHLP